MSELSNSRGVSLSCKYSPACSIPKDSIISSIMDSCLTNCIDDNPNHTDVITTRMHCKNKERVQEK